MEPMEDRSVVDLTRLPEYLVHLLFYYILPGFLVLMILWGIYVGFRYRRRRRYEERVTGRQGSLTQLRDVKLGKGEKASEWNPAMPAVVVSRLPAEKLVVALKDCRGYWTYPGGPVGEPHVAILGRTGSGKNETLFDPAVYNALFFRPDPVVINDVKAAVFRKYFERVSCDQYPFSFDPAFSHSAAINLVQTREMAEQTAASLYPIGGEKVKIFNRLARALFLRLCERIGYGEASLERVHRIASDRAGLETLAKTDPGVGAIIGGENRALAGDVMSSLLAPLEPLADPYVAKVFRACPDQPSFLEKMVVWIVIPEGKEEVLGPLAAALMRNLYERAKKVPRPVRFFVDEAGSCLAFDDLARFLQVGRGAGVYFSLVLQDISQLYEKIGVHNTNSALGGAGVQFWGPSNDPATTSYVSGLSGETPVSRAVYEDRCRKLMWRQLLDGGEGAPYRWETRVRAVIERQHVSGLPKGTWYRYAGDPHRIRLLMPAPMHAWPEDALPPKVEPRFRGIPEWLPAAAREALPDLESGIPGREPSEADRPFEERPPSGERGSPEDAPRPRPVPLPEEDQRGGCRTCPVCGAEVVSDVARFSECCGARL